MKVLKVLISAGPTREYIDAVRFITNASSGKMGYSIAEVAYKDGADVVLISGPVTVPYSENIKTIFVQTSKEMYEQVIKYFYKTDIFISAAAVCDWRPERRYNYKLKKTDIFNLKLRQTDDILLKISRLKDRKNKFVVGFALETENIVRNAIEKLRNKNLDLIVANSTKCIGGNSFEGHIIDKSGKIIRVNRIDKLKFAKLLWSVIKNLYLKKNNVYE